MAKARRAGGALALCLGLWACSGAAADWRAGAASDAESKIRDLVHDPAAQFSRIQVTGDDKTGQTCGYVSAAGARVTHATVRFIVFIDATAGPFVEPGLIDTDLSQQDFENAWQSECVREGYRA